jgi:hypothetical protein
VLTNGSTFKLEGNCRGATSRRYPEIELQVPLIAIEDEIHARVNLGITNLAKSSDIGLPLGRIVSDVVVNDSRERIRSLRFHSFVRSRHTDANDLGAQLIFDFSVKND